MSLWDSSKWKNALYYQYCINVPWLCGSQSLHFWESRLLTLKSRCQQSLVVLTHRLQHHGICVSLQTFWWRWTAWPGCVYPLKLKIKITATQVMVENGIREYSPISGDNLFSPGINYSLISRYFKIHSFPL